MDTRVLEYFLVVAREENITRAASELHLTQPTLSRQIKQLEEEVGVELFRRGKHRVQLTAEGAVFRRRAQELVSLAEKAKTEAADGGSTLTGEVSLGCNESHGMDELATAISTFRAKHPLVRFALLSGDNVEIREQLESGIVDAGLFVEPVSTEGLACVRLPRAERWGILARVDTNLGALESVRSGELAGVPLVTVMDETIHQELTAWSGRDAEKMVPVAHYNLLPNAAALVQKGEGVAICSEPTCLFEGLRFVPFAPSLELGSAMAWKAHRQQTRAAASFIAHLEATLNNSFSA